MKATVLILLLLSSVAHSALSPRTYNQLQDFQKELDATQANVELAAIIQKVDEFVVDYKNNDLAQALAFQIRAQANEKSGNSQAALKDIETAYKLKNLDVGTRSQLGISLAYLYFGAERYTDVIQVSLEYLSNTEKPSPTLLALLANAHFSMEDYKQGTPYIERACELAEKPNASWLNNALGGNYRLGNYDRALFFANLLVLNFPDNERYWSQRTGLQRALELYSDATSSSYLSYAQKFFKEGSQYYNLAVLLANEGVPVRSARLLEQAIQDGSIEGDKRNLKLLSQAWLQSKEIEKGKKTLATLFENHADSQSGITLLAYLIEDENWTQADSLGSRIVKQEDLTSNQISRTWLLTGIARHKLKKIKEAKLAFSEALKSPDYAEQAKSWLTFLSEQS